MRKIAVALAILGTSLLPTLYTAPAHAQTRTWVSGVGDDVNPCSRTAPCKTFAGAISKTANGGEINCLDSGGFGGVTITKSISIICTGVEGGVLVAGTNGIVVSAGPTDNVVLKGLDLFGSGTGTNGVNFLAGLLLIIDSCNIQQFATNGVNVASSTAGARTVIKNSTININGTQGSANSGGVTVATNGNVLIIDSLLQNNLNYGVQVTGSGNFATFIRSIVTPSGIVSVASGNLISVGPSNFFNSGSPTSSPTFQ